MNGITAGRIELIVGPMFAGKTTEMLRRVDRAELARKRVVVMKYSADNRYSKNNVSTHDLQMRVAIPCSLLLPHIEECQNFDVIGIDEGQFFPDVVEFSETLANCGKTVIVAGLDGDFRRQPFGRVLDLISRSESLTKLTAICTETGGDACYTQRTIDSQDLEIIGGAEIYRAASRTSYFHKPTNGEINLTIGPVQSGKTTELLRVLNRHMIAGRNPILIRPNDHGYQNKRVSKFECRTTTTLPSKEEIGDYQIIGIDDAHLYENIAEWADELANEGKLVVVAALDSNSDREPFDVVKKLFALSEKVQKLEAVCTKTGLPAPFSILNGIEMVPISRYALLQYLKNSQSINA